MTDIHADTAGAGGPITHLAHFAEPGKIDTTHGVVLYVENLTVRFDAFRAINDLSLYIREGELRCIIGPNGAGKTTLMDVITGKTGHRNATIEGEVYLGQTLNLLTMQEPQIAQLGIGRKFQKPSVFESQPVWENLYLADAGDRRWHAALNARITADVRERIENTLSTMKLESVAYRAAGELSHGQKQRLEIGMLLMQKPALLLLDEPVAGMTDRETAELAEILQGIRGTCSIVVVEHDMGFVSSLAGDQGTVTVLAAGTVLAQGTMQQVQQDPQVIESYLGR
ncbi:urea ABC transporter ATP-binding protein UrtD [Advenella mimigardefordensis]|uniref:Putative urea ABC transporter ATP-binding protein UrtD n=1 Tax=Advenella mimigardefordensis (strain DSM 17166 / LMG 22922 / DPN7) TaxID=1247726 RepID=W0PC53_ADVMD|nr:urea ABC transporter ATP-binding protein UrtD [Advenella mimigardefordensis]AHG64286.1 putative urea ABC transporter ATP-binding protein UrtD [Advenella mimigardefordensis DPN7]